MSEMFYIDGDTAERIKQGIADREIDVAKLDKMETSEQRLSVWEKYVPRKVAADINAQFEEAMASDEVDAMQDFGKRFVKAVRRALEVDAATKRLRAKIESSQLGDSLDSAML